VACGVLAAGRRLAKQVASGSRLDDGANMTSPPSSHPRVGMLATVRNRRGLITSVVPFPGNGGEVFHVVRVEYLDADGAAEDTLLWERELSAEVLAPTALPDLQRPPMFPADLDALCRAGSILGEEGFRRLKRQLETTVETGAAQ